MKKAGREKSGKGAAIAATAGEATLFEIGGREKKILVCMPKMLLARLSAEPRRLPLVHLLGYSRANISELESLKNRRLSFLNYIEFSDRRILMIYNC